MKNELQLLIDELQKEHDYLDNEMKLCIQEMDFLGAEAFKESFLRTREKLRVAKNLDNPNYDKISSLKKSVGRFKKLDINDELSSLKLESLKARIPKFESELSKLERADKKTHDDSDQLITCLENIQADKINQFSIEIEEDAIAIKLSKQDAGLRIEVGRTDSNSVYNGISKHGMTELKSIGFIVNEENAVREISTFQKSDIPQIMNSLSVIIYEVFNLYGNKKAVIKYNNDSNS